MAWRGCISIYPSVKDLPISDKRKEHVITNIIESFRNAATSRSIVNVKREDLTGDFLRLGFNLIIDKIWFVELEEQGTYYAYEDLGIAEGKEIGLSESRMVIESIMREADIKENRIKRSERLNEDLDKALSLLKDRTYNCDAILININDAMSFWLGNFELFEGKRSTSSFGLEGYYAKIPLYWSNSVPDKTILLINKNIGDFLVKKEIHADLLEINEEEVENILRSLPNLDREKLREKVRLAAEEVISFRFKNKEAATIVRSI
jgi:hypothetical protein